LAASLAAANLARIVGAAVLGPPEFPARDFLRFRHGIITQPATSPLYRRPSSPHFRATGSKENSLFINVSPSAFISSWDALAHLR